MIKSHKIKIRRRAIFVRRRRSLENAHKFFRIIYGQGWRNILDNWPRDEKGIPLLQSEISEM